MKNSKLYQSVLDFVAEEKFQGNNKLTVVPSTSLSDVFYLRIDDSMINSAFLVRVAELGSYAIFRALDGHSFDLQFIHD